MSKPARTLYEKIWDDHVVAVREDGTCVIWIDRHLVHEVTSPQAFEGLASAGRPLRHPELTLAVPDHSVPTSERTMRFADPARALQVETLRANAARFGIEHIDLAAARQGIVHIIGPEQGFTLPGLTVVCGDSHSSTHGAFGALGFGIGTSEIEHVFATQALILKPSKTMEVRVTGGLGFGVTAKDLALAIIGRIGADGGNGHVLEYRGDTVASLSMEARMTLCNMSIEAGARAGLVAPDDTTFDYLAGRPRAPTGADWKRAVEWWRSLAGDAGARFDRTVVVNAGAIAPLVTWGTSPEDVVPITGAVPDPSAIEDPKRRAAAERALRYMDLVPGTRMEDVAIQNVFIGSCTNGRIEDLRAAADVLRGRKLASGIRQAMVVPGSGLVRLQAEAEGLHHVFRDAGLEWRQAGCSMCVGMNGDTVPSGERCASTSNRNFEGRQGSGARTHLMSPAMAAAAAVTGRLADVRQLLS